MNVAILSLTAFCFLFTVLTQHLKSDRAGGDCSWNAVSSPWTSYLASLHLSFVTCKMGVMLSVTGFLLHVQLNERMHVNIFYHPKGIIWMASVTPQGLEFSSC